MVLASFLDFLKKWSRDKCPRLQRSEKVRKLSQAYLKYTSFHLELLVNLSHRQDLLQFPASSCNHGPRNNIPARALATYSRRRDHPTVLPRLLAPNTPRQDPAHAMVHRRCHREGGHVRRGACAVNMSLDAFVWPFASPGTRKSLWYRERAESAVEHRCVPTICLY